MIQLGYMKATTATILPLYRVTKFFTGGLLAGITASEETTVRFDVGFECHKPSGGSPYKIVGCEQIGTRTIGGK
jgi:hypothetical protein